MKVVVEGDPLMDAGSRQASLAILAIRTSLGTLDAAETSREEFVLAAQMLEALAEAGIGLAAGLRDEATVGVAMIEASYFQLANPDLPIAGVGVLISEPGDAHARKEA